MKDAKYETEIFRKPPVQFNEWYPNIMSHSGQGEFVETFKAKSITIVVTQECNLRCSYCYECGKNANNDLTEEKALEIIDRLFEEDAKNSQIINKIDCNGIVFDFIGGEPLLRIDMIDFFMERFLVKAISLNHRWKTNYIVSMISNGVLYFNEDVQKFIKKYAGRINFSITIDGNKQLHDSCRVFKNGDPSFDYAQKAYKDCLEKELTHSTKMTIAPANLPYLAEALIELAQYKGVNYIPANPIYEEEWTLEQAKEYYYQIKEFSDWLLKDKKYKNLSCSLFQEQLGSCESCDNKNYCGGTGKMLAFDTDGNIYPCLRYLPFASSNKNKRKKLIIGDSTNGLLNNKEQQEIFNELEDITLISQSPEKCINCPIGQGCGWCSGWNYDYYGTANKRFTGICNMHKARHMVNAYYWNSLYRQEGLSPKFKLLIPKDWALEIVSEEEYENLLELSKG